MLNAERCKPLALCNFSLSAFYKWVQFRVKCYVGFSIKNCSLTFPFPSIKTTHFTSSDCSISLLLWIVYLYYYQILFFNFRAFFIVLLMSYSHKLMTCEWIPFSYDHLSKMFVLKFDCFHICFFFLTLSTLFSVESHGKNNCLFSYRTLFPTQIVSFQLTVFVFTISLC